MASDALGADDTRLAGVGIETDSLMTAIPAGDIASPAAHALLAVNLRIDDGLAVKVGGGDEIRQFFAYDFCQLGDATLGEIMLKAEDEVVDDAVAVLHHSGAHLHVAAA